MTEVLINRNDLPLLIKSYEGENNSFKVINIIPKKNNNNAETYRFIMNGNECYIDVYYKKNNTKILPVGKNIETSNNLISFIKTNCMNPNVGTKQLIINTPKNFVENMLDNFKIHYSQVSISQKNNKYIFVGYNQDKVTLHQYNDKIMIQGKPLFVFSLIIDYIAQNLDISFEEYYNKISNYIGIKEPFTVIRNYMVQKLGNVYHYLDEALLKSLSSTITLLNQNRQNNIENYSGCITGAFITLEGYLKKILSKKYKYHFQYYEAFDLFRKKNGEYILKPDKIDCNQNESMQLCKLYTLFNNKRNTYLHASVNPAFTAIMPSYMDAKSIYEEIIQAIIESYNVIFGE